MNPDLTDLGPMFQLLARSMGRPASGQPSGSAVPRVPLPTQPWGPAPKNTIANPPDYKAQGPGESTFPPWGSPSAFPGDDQRFDPTSPLAAFNKPPPTFWKPPPGGLDGNEGDDQRFDPASPLAPKTTQPGWTPVAGYEGDLQTGKPFTNVQGFDWEKTISGTGKPGKYTPAFTAFSHAINGIGADDPSSTPRVLAYLRANGFPNVTAISDDKWDFGDGNGPIDVKIDGGKGGWWFQNGPDRFGGGAPATSSAPQPGAGMGSGGGDLWWGGASIPEPGMPPMTPFPWNAGGGALPGASIPEPGAPSSAPIPRAPTSAPAQPANARQPLDLDAIINAALRHALL